MISADMYIDYSDARKNISIPVAPQSWLRTCWLPIARANEWRWIERICDNTLQVFEHPDARQLLTQLHLLIEVLEANSQQCCDRETRDAMVGRLHSLLPHIADAVENWDGVKLISIG